MKTNTLYEQLHLGVSCCYGNIKRQYWKWNNLNPTLQFCEVNPSQSYFSHLKSNVIMVNLIDLAALIFFSWLHNLQCWQIRHHEVHRVSMMARYGSFLSFEHNDAILTSSKGNIFRVTGHLCGKFTGEFPTQRPVTRSFDVFFDLHLKRLSKQWWGWWFETPSHPSWRHCNMRIWARFPHHRPCVRRNHRSALDPTHTRPSVRSSGVYFVVRVGNCLTSKSSQIVCPCRDPLMFSLLLV